MATKKSHLLTTGKIPSGLKLGKLKSIPLEEVIVGYSHVCNKIQKCKCGWNGCICETKWDSKKISEKETKCYQRCPKCSKIVSSSTQTTT